MSHSHPSFVLESKCPEASRATPCAILNRAKITSRQYIVTSLEVPLKKWELLHCTDSKACIWTTTNTHMHMHVMSASDSAVAGLHIHFIPLLLSWTGLSICHPQNFLSKSIKLSCPISSAFLSLFFSKAFLSASSLMVSFFCCTFEVTDL